MLMVLMPLSPVRAQDEPEKINTNLGFSASLPLNPTAQFTHTGWGANAGVGYNLAPHHALIGEFMWNRLYPESGALAPILPVTGVSKLNGHSDVYALTGDYRLEVRGARFGTYFIGGAGWYYRFNSLSKEVNVVNPTICTPAWVWWGFGCTSGSVTAGQAHTSSGSSAFGGNGGIGFTVKVYEPSYRVYFETRYHYAPTKNINTQIVNVTVGIRY
jgi:hypothetical protein